MKASPRSTWVAFPPSLPLSEGNLKLETFAKLGIAFKIGDQNFIPQRLADSWTSSVLGKFLVPLKHTCAQD